MEEPDPFNNIHSSFPTPKQSKSHSLFKYYTLVALLLVFIFLFPLDFITNQTSIPKLWELITLLFVCIIAISYGFFFFFFGRTAEGFHNIEPDLGRDFPGFSHFSSVFEDGYDERTVIQTWDWSPISDKTEEDPTFEISQKNGSDEKLTNKTRNYGKPPLIVLAREKWVVDDCVKPTSVNNYYKPLNLPVRNLISETVENNRMEECVKENVFALAEERLDKESDNFKKGKFRGLTPTNLEKKFEEAVALPSPIPWRSRSNRNKARENVKPLSRIIRATSVGVLEVDSRKTKEIVGIVGSSSFGDFEFEHFNSQFIPNRGEVGEDNNAVGTNILNLRPIKIKTSGSKVTGGCNKVGFDDYLKVEAKPNQMKLREEKRNAKSPPCVWPSSSVDEFRNDKMKSSMAHMETRKQDCNGELNSDLVKSQSFWSGIFSPVNVRSPKKSSPVPDISIPGSEVRDFNKKGSSFTSSMIKIDDGSLIMMREHDIGFSLELNLQKHCDDTLKQVTRSIREGKRGKRDKDLMKAERKPAAQSKSLQSGKSVRTIRSKQGCLNSSRMGNFFSDSDEKLGRTKNHDLEDASSKERSRSIMYQNWEKQNFCACDEVQTEKGCVCDIENFKVRSVEKEEADSAVYDEEDLDSDEVDKKADAFIAKFREQIRLQKIDSIKRKRGYISEVYIQALFVLNSAGSRISGLHCNATTKGRPSLVSIFVCNLM